MKSYLFAGLLALVFCSNVVADGEASESVTSPEYTEHVLDSFQRALDSHNTATFEAGGDGPVESYCCKVCSKGKACGDSCIARYKTCHKGPGCACDG